MLFWPLSFFICVVPPFSFLFDPLLPKSSCLRFYLVSFRLSPIPFFHSYIFFFGWMGLCRRPFFLRVPFVKLMNSIRGLLPRCPEEPPFSRFCDLSLSFTSWSSALLHVVRDPSGGQSMVSLVFSPPKTPGFVCRLCQWFTGFQPVFFPPPPPIVFSARIVFFVHFPLSVDCPQTHFKSCPEKDGLFWVTRQFVKSSFFF